MLSTGVGAFSSGTKSPNLPSSSLPIGASSETGSLVILITCFTLSTGSPTSFAI